MKNRKEDDIFMKYVIAIMIGYLLGCSHMSYYISRFKKVNLKADGSKNYGASNTTLLLGVKAGILVLLHDLLKSYLAVVVANLLFPDIPYVGVIAGMASVVGHIYPFYLNFDGGKGFASFMGALLGVEPVFMLCLMLAALIFAFILDYVVAGTFSIITIAPIHIAAMQHDINMLIIIGMISVLIFVKHKENVKNLVSRNGREAKIKEVLFKKK